MYRKPREQLFPNRRPLIYPSAREKQSSLVNLNLFYLNLLIKVDALFNSLMSVVHFSLF